MSLSTTYIQHFLEVTKQGELMLFDKEFGAKYSVDDLLMEFVDISLPFSLESILQPRTQPVKEAEELSPLSVGVANVSPPHPLLPSSQSLYG